MAVKSCTVCGSPIQVNAMDTEVSCKACGSVYDVSVSPERGLTAEKTPTRAGLFLFDETWTTRLEDTTQFVGTRILLSISLHTGSSTCYSCEFYPNLCTDGRPVDVYHRVNGGPWEKIRTVTIGVTSDTGGPSHCGADIFYTLTSAGRHDFYSKFAGTPYLAGCPSKVHGVLINSEYSVSPEGGLTALPALTVIVKNMVTKKPVAGATVIANAYEHVTDETGTAVFTEIVAAGTYAIHVSAPNYIKASRRIELTEAGAVVEIGLMPIWVIPVGVSAVGGLILVATKAAKWW